MNFKTAYNLASQRINFFNEPLPTLYLFFIIGTGLLIFYRQNRNRIKNAKTLSIGIFFIFISSLFLLIFLYRQFSDIHKARQMIQVGNFYVVEGIPANYHPMPKEGHDMERFNINGVHFAYSDYILRDAGYNNAASLSGVIVPNKYYRLTYYISHDDIDSNKILKIEIRQ